MGIATILETRKIVLLVTGTAKADALAKVLSGREDQNVPGSALIRHPRVKVIADRQALQKLRSIDPQKVKVDLIAAALNGARLFQPLPQYHFWTSSRKSSICFSRMDSGNGTG